MLCWGGSGFGALQMLWTGGLCVWWRVRLANIAAVQSQLCLPRMGRNNFYWSHLDTSRVDDSGLWDAVKPLNQLQNIWDLLPLKTLDNVCFTTARANVRGAFLDEDVLWFDAGIRECERWKDFTALLEISEGKRMFEIMKCENSRIFLFYLYKFMFWGLQLLQRSFSCFSHLCIQLVWKWQLRVLIVVTLIPFKVFNVIDTFFNKHA